MKGKRILLVEDDESIREVTKDLLELEGYSVKCAEDGAKAIEALSNGVVLPNLILLDLMMPVMDGYQFCCEMKKDPRLALIPVVIMTADGHAEEKKTRLGAVGYLKKPVDIDTVIEVVKRCSL